MQPELLDDYYLNLMDWGKNNVIAVALHQNVYLWHSLDGHIDELMKLDGSDDYVTSVQWSKDKDNVLAVGTASNTVQLWDASSLSKVRDLTGHSSRVSSLSWNGSVVCSGSRDSSILHHDPRIASNVTATYTNHDQEVCGLTWSPDGTTLASGGNENRLCIWDAAMSGGGGSRNSSSASTAATSRYQPRFVIEQHTAAVKALAWCPWQRHSLASGGGTADRTIRVWNASTGACLKCVDTGSQVYVGIHYRFSTTTLHSILVRI